MSMSIGSVGANEDIHAMMLEMFNKINKADTDGTTGLSLEELSSVDTSKDVGGQAFIKSLTEQFEDLDSNSDGQLSKDEMAYAKPTQDKLGMPADINIAGTDTKSNSVDSYQELLNSLINSLMSKLDTDGDGSISAEEMSAAIQKLSETSQKSTASENSVTNGELATSANDKSSKETTNLADIFIQKLIDAYKDNTELSDLMSSLVSSVA